MVLLTQKQEGGLGFGVRVGLELRFRGSGVQGLGLGFQTHTACNEIEAEPII